ncbi:hypothetical protein ACFLS5_01530 [Candidatus Bipolaricaulota bacterium]
MKMRAMLLIIPLFLSGCLFSTNHPLVGPDGTAAVFLSEAGEYSLYLEQGTIHLLRDGELVPLPLTAVAGPGGVPDWTPDGLEFLYVQYEMSEWLEPLSSTLYRVAPEPEATPVVVYTSELSIRDAAFRADGQIVVLEHGDDTAGTLSILDPETGELKEVSDAVLGFRQDANRETLYLLSVDEEAVVPIGVVGPWEPANNSSEPLAVFVLSGGMLDGFYMLDDEFFWDIDPQGHGVALTLYDNVMVSPLVDEEIPSLFFVENGERVTKIAEIGYMPTFSPDGRYLAYMGTNDGQTGQAKVFEPRTLETYPIPGSQGASTCFWMGEDRLGLTFELDDDVYRLAAFDFSLGRIVELIE